VITQNDIHQLAQATVYDADGDKVGGVGQVYLDADSGDPEWVTVKTGLFGTKETFVPLDKASFSGDRIEVPFDKARIKDAPRIEADGPLSTTEEDELYSYYGIASSGGRVIGGGAGTTTGGTSFEGDRAGDIDTDRDLDRDRDIDRDRDLDLDRDSDRFGRSDRGSDDAMTRSEERPVAGTQTEQTGNPRLRKYVGTEQQQVDVPVTREEEKLDREPITDADRTDRR